MKKFYVLVSILASALFFQNCRIEIQGEPIDFKGPNPLSDLWEINYEANGGYGPAPRFTSLTLSRSANGSVFANLKSDNCNMTSDLSANDFYRLQRMIESSPKIDLNPQFLVVDNATSQVKLTYQSHSESYWLTQLGTRGTYLVDGATIEAALQAVVAGLKGMGCGTTTTVRSVRFQSLTKFTGVSFYPGIGGSDPSSEDIDLNVEFQNGRAFITGHISTMSSAKLAFPDCQTNYKGQEIPQSYPQPTLPVSTYADQITAPALIYNDLQVAADGLRFVHTGIICAVAAVVGPIGVSIPRTLTSTKIDGLVQTGNFGCMYSDTVVDARGYLPILDRYLSQTDRCSANPLGVRGISVAPMTQ